VLRKVKVWSVDVNHYQTLNELKVEKHPDKTFIGQKLVAMGEHWCGDMCCEQSTLMEGPQSASLLYSLVSHLFPFSSIKV